MKRGINLPNRMDKYMLRKLICKEALLLFLLSLLCALIFTSCGTYSDKKVLKLATTTTVNDSGLLGFLIPLFEKDTGIKLKAIVQATGQAIKTGENGDADILFVHDKKSEEKFVSDGNGEKRIEIMYNYFIIVGPMEDTASIKMLQEKNAAKALKQIMDKKASFISRGDESGTNKKESSLWQTMGINPTGKWYVSAGKGMGEVLSMASEKQAYTLSDKATFLVMKDRLNLQIVLESSRELLNQYTVIEVNPNKHKGINYEGAQKFVEWITSEKILKLINDYGKDKFGESLFTVNYSR